MKLPAKRVARKKTDWEWKKYVLNWGKKSGGEQKYTRTGVQGMRA